VQRGQRCEKEGGEECEGVFHVWLAHLWCD
jgi:hypothetical protein